MLCITTFGALVLSGVVEEKASRVVEVLLTRVSARESPRGQDRRHRPARPRPDSRRRPSGSFLAMA